MAWNAGFSPFPYLVVVRGVAWNAGSSPFPYLVVVAALSGLVGVKMSFLEGLPGS